jgi:nucleotide-binding universal stress UspA family protein
MAIRVQRVLAATDFSAAGQRAVQVAAEWARHAHAQLRIVHVTPPEVWVSRAWGLETSVAKTIQRHATNALKQVAENVDPARTIELSTGVLSGAAARSIADAVRDYRADLLVIGARGERDADGERALGGTAGKLLSTAETPLLLVRRTREDLVASVVAAVDLSPHSQTVLEWADFAAAGRHLHAYHVYDVPFAARLGAYGLSASAIDAYGELERSQHLADLAAVVASIARSGATSHAVERGDPAVQLRRYVESVRASLVVLGKHAKGVRTSPASSIGNVCRFTASSVSADVLVV